MAQWIGASGGKQRSATTFTGAPLRSIDRNLVSIQGTRGLNNELLGQITEALRTGGIGAQIPIIQQSVSASNQAASDALRQTRDSLAQSGLSRTPYGQSILAGTRMQGAQQTAAIPTQIAQSFIEQAPQFSSSLMGQILNTLQKSTARSGPYGV